jgi:gluconolactonase
MIEASGRIAAAAFIVCIFTFGSGFAQVSPGMQSVVAPGANLEKLPATFVFTEGPVADREGNFFFSDALDQKIYEWTTNGALSVFWEDPKSSVGLDFDTAGNLIAASNPAHAILSIDMKTKRTTVVADSCNGKPLNSPNDVWCDPKGGVYFTDPRFMKLPFPKEQDVEGVYYISPDRKRITRVIGDLRQPNGVVGTPDGKHLYVDDTPAKQTYVYTINPDGTLTDRRLFVSAGLDGMALDTQGNVYIVAKGVDVYTPDGKMIENIPVTPDPTNVAFGGSDGRTLFITARTVCYTLRMRIPGVMFGRK